MIEVLLYVLFFYALLILPAVYLWSLRQQLPRTWKHPRRQRFISLYEFQPSLKTKLLDRYPQLDEAGLGCVVQGLRVYFSICLRYDRKTAMPSRGADAAWHEFLLDSREYTEFCKQAFGDYLHHIPVARLESPLAAQTSLLNAWWRSCEDEGIDPANPQRLPLLFALDAELAITNGFNYSIEAGRFPRKPEGIPPAELCQEIEQALPFAASQAHRESVAWEAATGKLAVKIKRYLFDDDYCKAHGRDALAPMFEAILARADLAVAIFGDIALALGRQRQVKQFPPPPEASCGCSSSGQSE